jgi:hypothetical protein
MNWTTPKLIALVVATSVLSSVCTMFLMRHMMPGFADQQGQAAMWQGGMMGGGMNMQFEPSDPQALADLESKVKERQGIVETANEIEIDLKPYVNCKLTDPLADEPDKKDHTMADLPLGLNTYGGVPFNLQGLIQLNGPSVQTGIKLWPLEVKDIAIGHPFKKLHLLHGAFHIDGPGAHLTFAKLILHYADGSKEELELIGGTHALRCTSQSVPPMLSLIQAPQTELAWLGSNPYLKKNNPGASLHLYRTTLDNPRPQTQVTTIDYLSTMVNPGPFIAGLTVE